MLKETDSAIFPDIPSTHKNMAGNDNRYVLSDEETKVFLDLIRRRLWQFEW